MVFVHNYFPHVLVLQVLLFIVMGNKSLVLWVFVFPSLVLVSYFTSNIAFVLYFFIVNNSHAEYGFIVMTSLTPNNSHSQYRISGTSCLIWFFHQCIQQYHRGCFSITHGSRGHTVIVKGVKITLEIRKRAHCYVFPTMAENCVLRVGACDVGSLPVNLFQPHFSCTEINLAK